MPYTTPIFDRAQSDINAGNAKAFLNVADWVRIYSNAILVNDLFDTEIGYYILWNTTDIPTTSSIPSKTSVNVLTGNIERMRLWAAIYLSAYITDPLFVEIKDDWESGHMAAAPNFTHVNSWEKVLDVLYNLLSTWTPPVISGDLLLLTDAISLSNTDLIG